MSGRRRGAVSKPNPVGPTRKTVKSPWTTPEFLPRTPGVFERGFFKTLSRYFVPRRAVNLFANTGTADLRIPEEFIELSTNEVLSYVKTVNTSHRISAPVYRRNELFIASPLFYPAERESSAVTADLITKKKKKYKST